MMDQTHIGYTSWEPPRQNNMPRVTELTLPDTADFGVALDGSTAAWPGESSQPVLPVFDSFNPQTSYIEVFARGTQTPVFKTVADQPWIILKEDKAPGAGQDRRVWVSIDWSKAPAGPSEGAVSVSGGTNSLSVKVKAIKATPEQTRDAAGCFAALAGPISILASDATINTPAGGAKWEKIPDLGRYKGAMEVFPVTAETVQPPKAAPSLGYPIYFAHAGAFDVEVITSPTLDVIPTRGLGLGVSIDDQTHASCQRLHSRHLQGRRF